MKRIQTLLAQRSSSNFILRSNNAIMVDRSNKSKRMLCSLVQISRAIPYESVLSQYVKCRGQKRKNPRLISTVEKALEILRANQKIDILKIMNEKGWTQKQVGNLVKTNISDLFTDNLFAARLLGNDSDNFAQIIDAMMFTDYQVFMKDDVLTKVDRASMSVSLECRDPFVDHRIAEFAFSLPIEYLYANGEQKRILKHILRRWISEPILNTKKRGFVIPLYEWMKGPWRPLIHEYLSTDRIRAVGVLDENIVASEVKRFYKYEGVGAEKLQLLLNFQMWAERWYR